MPKQKTYNSQMVLRMTDRQDDFLRDIAKEKGLHIVDVVRAMLNYSLKNQPDFLRWLEEIRGI